jgi:D-Tyr-tRNAtyr deacylase
MQGLLQRVSEASVTVDHVVLINDGPVTIPMAIAPTDHSEYHTESRTSNAKH